MGYTCDHKLPSMHAAEFLHTSISFLGLLQDHGMRHLLAKLQARVVSESPYIGHTNGHHGSFPAMLDLRFVIVGACEAACQSYAPSLATECSQLLVLVQSDASLNGASNTQLEAAGRKSKPSPV